MTSKLDLAKQAIADLKKAAEAGEDITKSDLDALDMTLVTAQNTEILKALAGLSEAKKVKAIVKQEDDEDEDKKPAFLKDDDDEEKSVLLDLALEEIVRLRKQDDEAEEDEDEDEAPIPIEESRAKKAISKQEDDEDDKAKDEEKAIKKGPDPGPAADLPKPDSDDYEDSKETVQKAEDDKEETDEEKAAAFNTAVQKSVASILKGAGFVASSTPVPQIVTGPGNIAAAATGDLQKSWETLKDLPFKTINKFRMEVDPSLRNLSQSYFTPGRGRI